MADEGWGPTEVARRAPRRLRIALAWLVTWVACALVGVTSVLLPSRTAAAEAPPLAPALAMILAGLAGVVLAGVSFARKQVPATPLLLAYAVIGVVWLVGWSARLGWHGPLTLGMVLVGALVPAIGAVVQALLSREGR